MSQHYDIFDGCKRKDPRAQRMLYELFKSKLMGISRRYAASFEEAQDVLQEAFIKIFKSIHQLESTDKLEGWMKSIVVRTAIDCYHKQKAREVLFSKFDDESLNVKDEQDILRGMTDVELIGIVNSLPTGCRLIFNLYAIEGYNHPEIAVMLSISEGTSRSQYHHAKSLLKEKLKSIKPTEYYGKLA